MVCCCPRYFTRYDGEDCLPALALNTAGDRWHRPALAMATARAAAAAAADMAAVGAGGWSDATRDRAGEVVSELPRHEGRELLAQLPCGPSTFVFWGPRI